MRHKFLILLSLIWIAGCAGGNNSGQPVTENPVPQPVERFEKQNELPWENFGIYDATSASRDNRKLWSNQLYNEIHTRKSSFLTRATDAKYFCPNYDSLNERDRLNFWAQLMVQISKWESGYNPTARFREPRRIDKVTGKPLLSEGLFQMSHQDIMASADCQFDWVRDSLLHPRDPRKTTYDPFLNIRCAAAIMAKQLNRTGKIVLNKRAYWAVISRSHKNRIPQISYFTANLPYCRR
jgi:hypothetical protein